MSSFVKLEIPITFTDFCHLTFERTFFNSNFWCFNKSFVDKTIIDLSPQFSDNIIRGDEKFFS